MAKEFKLTFEYEPRLGYLAIDKGIPRYEEQDEDEPIDGIICRYNPETGAVESADIHIFSSETSEAEREALLGKAVAMLTGLDQSTQPILDRSD